MPGGPDTRKYLEEHQSKLEDALSEAVRATLAARSADPLKFLANLLADAASSAPLSPKREPSPQTPGVTQRGIRAAQQQREQRPVAQQSTRMMFRKSLHQVVGGGGAGRTWRDEYEKAVDEGNELLGKGPTKAERKTQELLHKLNVDKGFHKERVDAGFTDEEAQVVGAVMSAPIEAAIAKARAVAAPRPPGRMRLSPRRPHTEPHFRRDTPPSPIPAETSSSPTTMYRL